MVPPRAPPTVTEVEAAKAKHLDKSVEIDRRTRVCWMRIRQYLREIYHQPKVSLSLNTGVDQDNRGPLIWMQYVNPFRGTIRQPPHRTPNIPLYHRGIE